MLRLLWAFICSLIVLSQVVALSPPVSLDDVQSILAAKALPTIYGKMLNAMDHQSYDQYNSPQNVQSARGRGFFEPGTRQSHPWYPQNVLAYPQDRSSLKDFVSSFPEEVKQALWLPHPDSYHMTIHTLLASGQLTQAAANRFNNPQLKQKFVQAIRECLPQEVTIVLEHMILTQDGSLILVGQALDPRDNERLFLLRRRLQTIQAEHLSEGDTNQFPSILHVSLGRLVPNNDQEHPSFEMTEAQFAALQQTIQSYNQRPSDQKIRISFKELSLVVSDSPVHENPRYREDIVLPLQKIKESLQDIQTQLMANYEISHGRFFFNAMREGRPLTAESLTSAYADKKYIVAEGGRYGGCYESSIESYVLLMKQWSNEDYWKQLYPGLSQFKVESKKDSYDMEVIIFDQGQMVSARAYVFGHWEETMALSYPYYFYHTGVLIELHYGNSDEYFLLDASSSDFFEVHGSVDKDFVFRAKADVDKKYQTAIPSELIHPRLRYSQRGFNNVSLTNQPNVPLRSSLISGPLSHKDFQKFTPIIKSTYFDVLSHHGRLTYREKPPHIIVMLLQKKIRIVNGTNIEVIAFGDLKDRVEDVLKVLKLPFVEDEAVWRELLLHLSNYSEEVVKAVYISQAWIVLMQHLDSSQVSMSEQDKQRFKTLSAKEKENLIDCIYKKLAAAAVQEERDVVWMSFTADGNFAFRLAKSGLQEQIIPREALLKAA